MGCVSTNPKLSNDADHVKQHQEKLVNAIAAIEQLASFVDTRCNERITKIVGSSQFEKRLGGIDVSLVVADFDEKLATTAEFKIDDSQGNLVNTVAQMNWESPETTDEASYEFFEDVTRLKGLLIWKARVANFLKGLLSTQIKFNEILTQEQPKFMPSEFAEGIRLLALQEFHSMERIQDIFDEDDFKAVIFGLFKTYDCFINDEEAEQLMHEVEVQAKLMCLMCLKIKKDQNNRSKVQVPYKDVVQR